MGILDQLRKEAESKKQVLMSDAELVQRREETYQRALLPAMQKLLQALQEVMEYLKDMDPVVIKDYSTLRPEVGRLIQRDYKLNTDGQSGFVDSHKLRQINLSYRLKGEGAYEYKVIGKLSAETEQDFLFNRGIRSDAESKLDANGTPIFMISIKRDLPVYIRFEVDYENSNIKFRELNQENFSTSSAVFAAEDVTDEWIDEFFGFLLRKNSTFASKLKRRMPQP